MSDINDLKIYITTPNGEQIPLQLASIEYGRSIKISETTRIEVVVGINVRLARRHDIQKIVNTEIKLPSGYMFNMEDSLKIFKVLKPD
jgi:Cu/Ag efflux pump CusA